ncbi:MAG: CbtA family protein [Ferrovibrio sp.]|uniref:CbtA family protein n=1 Tax=Ferrovibrio sp. TaxID=1917215 RepID=UPI00260E5AB6|nr:CbtA family protein [Ferrovibrio sp.]MCW0233691.1 CbtA family protein [Ferrovibrio sp.]
MPFRLLAAAFMAALLATLGLMFLRVATTPAGQLDIAEGDFLLLRHLALGLCGGLTLQVVFLHKPPGIYRGLAWGGAGFLALTLMPWLALPGSMPGRVSPEQPLLWLSVMAASAGGLWLLWWPGDSGKPSPVRRLGGLALLLLAGVSGGGFEDGLPRAEPMADDDPELGVWRGLGLNLLFWLLLGLFSVLAARRVVQRPGPDPDPKTGPDHG